MHEHDLQNQSAMQRDVTRLPYGLAWCALACGLVRLAWRGVRLVRLVRGLVRPGSCAWPWAGRGVGLGFSWAWRGRAWCVLPWAWPWPGASLPWLALACVPGAWACPGAPGYGRAWAWRAWPIYSGRVPGLRGPGASLGLVRPGVGVRAWACLVRQAWPWACVALVRPGLDCHSLGVGLGIKPVNKTYIFS